MSFHVKAVHARGEKLDVRIYNDSSARFVDDLYNALEASPAFTDVVVEMETTQVIKGADA